MSDVKHETRYGDLLVAEIKLAALITLANADLSPSTSVAGIGEPTGLTIITSNSLD